MRRACIQDISQGGIALLLRHSLPKGKQILIQLQNDILGIGYDLSAKVVHSSRLERDCWITGCAFSRELTEMELSTLLL
jgi:ribosomal protein S13